MRMSTALMPDDENTIAKTRAVVLRATSVARTVGYRNILRKVSLELREGEALGIMGPNGAGKTTLLRVLAGLSRPSVGTVDLSCSFGFVGHFSMLYDALTARENLRFVARLYDVGDLGKIDAVLEHVGLADKKLGPVSTFSRGMIQRLSIARAIIHDPKLLILDEPLSGLDESGAAAVLDLFSGRRDDGCSMVLVSHQPAVVARLATSVAFLVSGSLREPVGEPGMTAELVGEWYRGAVANA